MQKKFAYNIASNIPTLLDPNNVDYVSHRQGSLCTNIEIRVPDGNVPMKDIKKLLPLQIECIKANMVNKLNSFSGTVSNDKMLELKKEYQQELTAQENALLKSYADAGYITINRGGRRTRKSKKSKRRHKRTKHKRTKHKEQSIKERNL